MALAAPAPPATSRAGDLARDLHALGTALRERVARVVIGLDDAVEHLLVALLAEGHVLLEGVPGLGKTLLVSTLADALDLQFRRIQFTPDLMPSDVTGTEVLVQGREGRREFQFLPGPIFGNVVLADEINRTPPKTQAALMEGMEERQVTSLGVRRPLDRPFFVLATQNPIEQQGTYPLPAAQLDRFLVKVRLVYPTPAEEAAIVRRTTAPGPVDDVGPLLAREDLVAFQRAVAAWPVPAEVLRYAVALSRATRPGDASAPQRVRDYVSWGVGPRAPQSLVSCARVRSLLRGHAAPTVEDVRAMAPAVFRHRLIVSYAAEADGVSADDVTAALLEAVPCPHRAPVARPSFLRRLFARLLPV